MGPVLIGKYSFGAMTVGATVHRRDLIVLGDRALPDWVRRQGHRLDEEDLGGVLAWGPELLIVGTGAFGRMVVPEALRDRLAARGVEVRAAPTPRAAELFNEEVRRGHRVAGAFHLTC